MANTSISLTSLDFADYKNSLKTFLQSQDRFKDYNFDGSNLSVILDLLAYNTYQNAFYMNMIGSEMFLDTAQQRDSVVLRAKELNYTPRSFRSSSANVSLTITPTDSNISLITIPKGTSFTSKAGSNNYTFSTDQMITVTSGNGVFIADNVSIYEGTYVTDTFVVQPSSNTDRQKFVLSNPTIDTTSLTVTGLENNGANTVSYKLASNILDLKTDSNVYFLQGSENSKFELLFGDNVVGKKPLDGSAIIVEYRSTNGQLPNGVSKFTPNGQIGGTSNVIVTTVSSASGGDIAEDIESIRRNAPRFYATQDRAVTVKDYETLFTVNYPEIQAISVYGGEDASPPQYGSVLISMKIANFDAVPTSKKAEYTTFISTRAPLTIRPVFIEPNYTYVSVNSNVKYNVNQTSLNPEDINTLVTDAIQNYNLTNLNNFKATLLYSRLVNQIDNAHASIVSNETDYVLMKKIVPSTSTQKNYTIEFNTALDDALPPQPLNHIASDRHTVYSTKFYYSGQLVSLEDDGVGKMRIVSENANGEHTTLLDIGTVDYTNGRILLNNFLTTNYVGDAIRIYVMPNGKDNSSNKNTILEIPNDEINVTVQIVRQ